MLEMLKPVIDNLFNTAMDEWKANDEFNNFRLSTRDRLRRESMLNAELLKEISNDESIINELSITTIQNIFDMPIPISKIFDNHISEESRIILNSKFQRWTKNIIYESNLVERCWHRMRVLQIRNKNNNVTRTNVGYLIVLNKALAYSL